MHSISKTHHIPSDILIRTNIGRRELITGTVQGVDILCVDYVDRKDVNRTLTIYHLAEQVVPESIGQVRNPVDGPTIPTTHY